MTIRVISCAAALAVLSTLGAPLAARADDPAGIDDFAFTLKESTGDYYATYVLTKLHSFHLGPKCWAKVVDKGSGAIHAAGFITRDIAEYAKRITKDDWAAIETQGNSAREQNKALVEPMVAAFASHLMVNITVEGDDCDAKQASLWIRYWSEAVKAVTQYPLPQPTVVVNITASSKARAVTVTRSKDGSTFSIVAPKDIEPRGVDEAIARPFRLINSGIPDDYAFAVKEATGHYDDAWVMTKLHTFKVGKACLAKFSDKNASVIHHGTFITSAVKEYVKAVGGDDWDEIEGQSANDKETNRGIVEQSMTAFAPKLHITVAVEGDDCDVGLNAMWLRYWSQVTDALRDHPPKAKKVAIVLNVTSKAKDVTVKAAKDGASFTITAPRDREVAGWTDKLDAAFLKVARAK